MKKTLIFLVFQSAIFFTAFTQTVSNYVYKLDNGIVVKTERCWNQVWIQQSFSPAGQGDKTAPLSVNIRALGDLISGSEFKLLKAGKEVKMQTAGPGTYDLQMSFKLSGKPGKLGFTVNNVEIKAATKTNVSVTLYDYQINIEEKQVALSGLSEYESLVQRCKSHTVQDTYYGIPSFYDKGKHDKALIPDQAASKTKGKIKPGTYDLLVTIAISDQTQKVWLENVQLKPDISYRITVNLNAGGIVYTGGNTDVKALMMYPAGTAQKQTGKPEPINNLQLISYENVTVANCCSPGTYDVLLKYARAQKYEWKKNIAISSGTRTEVK